MIFKYDETGPGRASPLGPWVLIAMLLLAPARTEAGILDSIKKLFGGGSSASETAGGGNEAIDKALTQVESSQQQVAESQQSLTKYYNDPNASISPDDPELKSALDQMESASRSNEQMYMQFLQMRAEAASSKADVSSYEPRFQQITQTQDQLETNYQKIQEANREAQLYEAPAATPTSGEVMASATDSAPTKELGINSWMEPEVQGYIDEYLAGIGVNSWGQWEGRSATALVSGPNRPGAPGMQRHQVVYGLFLDDSKWAQQFGNMTLRAYIEARLDGEYPKLVRKDPGAVVRPSQTMASTTGSRTPTSTRASATSGQATVSATTTDTTEFELVQIDEALQQSRKNLEQLVAEGKGSDPEARQELDRIAELEERFKAIQQESR